MTCDVLIVNHNSTDCLLACLDSLEKAGREGDDAPGRIIVVDNASEDGIDDVVRFHPAVILRKNERNVGFARAVNQALSLSEAPYALLLNPDTVVVPGLFDTVVGYLEAHPETAAAGPRILDGDGALQGSARSFPSPSLMLFGRRSLLTRFFPRSRLAKKSIRNSESNGVSVLDVDWVSGAAMVLRRSAVEDAGFLDERFFMYWEDVDWCRRMKEKGWRVAYVPSASVIHYVGVSSSRKRWAALFMFHAGFLKYFLKYSAAPPVLAAPLVACGLAIRFMGTALVDAIAACGRPAPAPRRRAP